MPRLPPSLLLQAYSASHLLPLVLRGARTLDSAANELRWLREHAQTLKSTSPQHTRQKLLKLCQRRSRGEPLQYILGSQPFGELDIKCRPGVLIPRPETEAYTTYLAALINEDKLDKGISKIFHKQNPRNPSPALRILDVCSGSGCISLLLHSLLSSKFPSLKIFGLDISEQAITLAKENLALNVSAGHIPASATEDTLSHAPQVQFGLADIFTSIPKNIGAFDIIISNPPYISRESFNRETTRSVRNYEPRLALVPEVENADVFYERLIRMQQIYLSRVLVMEVGDAAQAIRVVELAFEMNHTGYHLAPRVTNRVEIWRDDPGFENVEVVREIAGKEVVFRGRGKVRAVVLFREKTDRHTGYRERLERKVLEKLDEPDVVRIAKEDVWRYEVKERRMEKRRGKALERKHGKGWRNVVTEKKRVDLFFDARLERSRLGGKRRERQAGGFGLSSWA